MPRCKRPDLEFNDAQRRMALTLAYLKVAFPRIGENKRTRLAESILMLIDGDHRAMPQKQITDAHAVEMVWRQSQCVLNQTGKCLLLVFGRQLAEEINEFFAEEE